MFVEQTYGPWFIANMCENECLFVHLLCSLCGSRRLLIEEVAKNYLVLGYSAGLPGCFPHYHICKSVGIHHVIIINWGIRSYAGDMQRNSNHFAYIDNQVTLILGFPCLKIDDCS